MNQIAEDHSSTQRPRGVDLFERANSEYDAGKFQEALADFDLAIEEGLESEIVYNNKGTTLDALGMYQDAIKCYRKAVSIRPSYELAWHNLGNCLYVQELFFEASRAYERAARLNKDRKENWSGLAASYSRIGDRKGASSATKRLGKFAEEDKSVLLLQSDLYLDAGFHEEALEKCQAYVDANPGDVQGLARLGNVAHEMGEYGKAIVAFDRALELSPGDKEVWNNLGYTYFSKGILDKAHECFDKAIEIDPEYKQAWYNKGYAYHGADMLEEAVRCYKRAIAIDPRDKVLWNNFGNALYNLGSYMESIPKFVMALKADPDYEIAWNNIGNALEKVGAFREAIPYHDRSLEVSPNFDYALYAKGVCKSKIGQLDEGYDLIVESLDLNPSYDEAWKARADVAAQLGRWDEALMSVEQSLLLNADFDEGWVQRAEILLACGDTEGAQASFEMALKCLEILNPMTSSGLMSLIRRGDVLARLGRFEEALANYETVTFSRKLDFMGVPRTLGMLRILGRTDLPGPLLKAFEASESTSALASFAEFLLDKGDLDALGRIAQKLAGTPAGSEELIRRASVHATRGDESGALALLACVKQSPSARRARDIEGELRESEGDLHAAANLYSRRLSEHPSDFLAAVSLCRVRLKMKDFRAALREADVAIGIDEHDWEPHKIKAEAYAALGDVVRSRAEAWAASARLAVAGLRPEDVEVLGAR